MQNILETVSEKKLEAFFLEKYEVEILLEKISNSFSLNLKNIFIWEDVTGEYVHNFFYQDNVELWEMYLNESLYDFNSIVYLTIANEEASSFSVLQCKKADLPMLLLEQSFFEYFVFDDTMKKIIFDTHENILITINSYKE